MHALALPAPDTSTIRAGSVRVLQTKYGPKTVKVIGKVLGGRVARVCEESVPVRDMVSRSFLVPIKIISGNFVK